MHTFSPPKTHWEHSWYSVHHWALPCEQDRRDPGPLGKTNTAEPPGRHGSRHELLGGQPWVIVMAVSVLFFIFALLKRKWFRRCWNRAFYQNHPSHPIRTSAQASTLCFLPNFIGKIYVPFSRALQEAVMTHKQASRVGINPEYLQQ